MATREEFDDAVRLWQEESGPWSNSEAMMNVPSFAPLVNMGEAVIPWILADLQREPSFLFIALRVITGENPIPRSHAGRIDLMVQDWLDWGTANGYPNKDKEPEWQKRGFFDGNDGWG